MTRDRYRTTASSLLIAFLLTTPRLSGATDTETGSPFIEASGCLDENGNLVSCESSPITLFIAAAVLATDSDARKETKKSVKRFFRKAKKKTKSALEKAGDRLFGDDDMEPPRYYGPNGEDLTDAVNRGDWERIRRIINYSSLVAANSAMAEMGNSSRANVEERSESLREEIWSLQKIMGTYPMQGPGVEEVPGIEPLPNDIVAELEQSVEDTKPKPEERPKPQDEPGGNTEPEDESDEESQPDESEEGSQSEDELEEESESEAQPPASPFEEPAGLQCGLGQHTDAYEDVSYVSTYNRAVRSSVNSGAYGDVQARNAVLDVSYSTIDVAALAYRDGHTETGDQLIQDAAELTDYAGDEEPLRGNDKYTCVYAFMAGFLMGSIGTSPMVESDFPTCKVAYYRGQLVGAIGGLVIDGVAFGTAISGEGVAILGTILSGGTAAFVGVPVAVLSAGLATCATASAMGHMEQFSKALNELTSGGGKFPGINQINKQIQRGQAPRGVQRADRGKIPGEQDHIHFSDGSALNRDGTWKHGGTELTNAQKKWLETIGWALP